MELIESGHSHGGATQWWTTLKFLVEQDAGPPLIGAIAIDITPRMRAEQALRASEDRYRLLVELAGSVIVVIDDQRRVLEFNREAEAFFGLSRADALGRYPYSAAMYLPGGRPPATGDRWSAPDLARTLTLVAKGGAVVNPLLKGA